MKVSGHIMRVFPANYSDEKELVDEKEAFFG